MNPNLFDENFKNMQNPPTIGVSLLIASTVQTTVLEAMKAQNLSQSVASRKSGVHRNFIIDLLRGHVPKVRSGNKYADEDPRYSCLASGLGLDALEFTAMAKKEQKALVRASSNPGDSETGVGRTRQGGLVVNLSAQTLALQNVSLAFDIPEGRVTITVQPHAKA